MARPKTMLIEPSLVLTKQPLTYSQLLAASLLLYADKDRSFGAALKKRLSALPFIPTIHNSDVAQANILLPEDSVSALKRTEWLLARINERVLVGSLPTQALLTTWQKNQDVAEPKQIVIGIAVGWIPGLTLGRITRRETMVCIIRKELTGKINSEVAAMIAKASLGVLAAALEMVNGDINKLEPELGDWFFGQRDFTFYSAQSYNLKVIKQLLDRLTIPHAAVEDGQKIAVLAVSPALNKDYLETKLGLEAPNL